eukprot:g15041.t1
MGYYCADWGLSTNLNPAYNSTNYPNSDLRKNYCRNPFKESDVYKANTIWCHTTDNEVRWQETGWSKTMNRLAFTAKTDQPQVDN